MKTEILNKISNYIYEIPKNYKKGMLVPARIYANRKILDTMDQAAVEQITNVAMLPGILKYAILLPDGHSGYGFPIGGVAGIDPDKGVISPGGIGFDINCGVRLVSTSLTMDDIRNDIKKLIDMIFKAVPAGVGGKGMVNLTDSRLDDAMINGAAWAVENGFGEKDDLEFTEENGCIKDADPAAVSQRARDRGRSQIGTLGSGNHFLEIVRVKKENIFDKQTAEKFGIFKDDQICFMIHSGSRAFGHQVATDYLKRFLSVMPSYSLSMPDRELACAPFRSKDGMAYYGAMNCAINIAFLNRQLIMHRIREVLSEFYGKSPDELGIKLVYDVCHNTAKLEKHLLDNKEQEVLVHRKGATRAFTRNMNGIPAAYRETGQPVLIGGSMETGSYLLTGGSNVNETFYSSVHGSGRLLSRTQAKKQFNGQALRKDMEQRGIYVQTASYPGLAEEAGGAYKNVDEVVEATKLAGLSNPVVRFIPFGNVKG